MTEQGKIVKFYINADQVEKWMHQNKACHNGCFVDGCLLDNFVVDTEIGFAMFYESYVNEWTSRYYVEYALNRKNKVCQAWREVWKNWNAFEEKARKEA